MFVLVAYATVEGQTRKIAERVAEEVEKRGHRAEIVDLAQPGFGLPARFDAAVLCGPIHIGRYPPALVSFVQNWKGELDAMPNAFVSVSLALASDDPEERAEALSYPARLSEATGWQPQRVHHAKGALRYLEYDFFKRWMMRRIAAKENQPVDTSKDYEFTDWPGLGEFIHTFLADSRSVKVKEA